MIYVWAWVIQTAILIAMMWAWMRTYRSINAAIVENTIAVGQLRFEVTQLSRAVDSLVNKKPIGGKK